MVGLRGDMDNVIVLRDDGGTPSEFRADMERGGADVGYPISTQLSDGTILTTYYITVGGWCDALGGDTLGDLIDENEKTGRRDEQPPRRGEKRGRMEGREGWGLAPIFQSSILPSSICSVPSVSLRWVFVTFSRFLLNLKDGGTRDVNSRTAALDSNGR